MKLAEFVLVFLLIPFIGITNLNTRFHAFKQAKKTVTSTVKKNEIGIHIPEVFSQPVNIIH